MAASPTVSIAPVGPLTLDVGQSQTFTATAMVVQARLIISGIWVVLLFRREQCNLLFHCSAGSYSVTCKVTDSASTPVTSPASNAVSVTVNQLTITVTQGANGVISPGTTSVNYGGSPDFLYYAECWLLPCLFDC